MSGDHHGHSHGGDEPPGVRRFMFGLGVALIAVFILVLVLHSFGVIP